ncbi:hypothetical protein N2152v2_007964 [Parachlorella kessleri]
MVPRHLLVAVLAAAIWVAQAVSTPDCSLNLRSFSDCDRDGKYCITANVYCPRGVTAATRRCLTAWDSGYQQTVCQDVQPNLVFPALDSCTIGFRKVPPGTRITFNGTVDASPFNSGKCCPAGSHLCGKATGCAIDYFDIVGPTCTTSPGKAPPPPPPSPAPVASSPPLAATPSPVACSPPPARTPSPVVSSPSPAANPSPATSPAPNGCTSVFFSMPKSPASSSSYLAYADTSAAADADAFCRFQPGGFGGAGAFRSLVMPDSFYEQASRWVTQNLSSGQVCTGAGCEAFGVIECVSAGRAALAMDDLGNVGCRNSGTNNVGSDNAGQDNWGNHNSGSSNVGDDNPGSSNIGNGNQVSSIFGDNDIPYAV